MADDDFKRFKKMYEEGEIKVLANPPPMPGPAGAVRGAVMNKGRKLLMDKLEKARQAGAKARSKPPKDTGTLTSRARAVTKRERTPKEKEKFGPLVKRPDNLPATQSRALVKREDKLPATRGSDSRALTVARENKGNLAVQGGRNGAVATGNRTFGDKGGAGRLGTNLKRAGAALGVGAAAYGLYKGADKPSASSASGGRDDRASSLSSNKSDKAAEFKAKRQGMKTKGSPTNPASGSKAAAKPAKAKREKPLTNFERMKMRGYEKEGIGGRSATSAGAKSRVKKERSYKFKDLFR